MKKSFEDIRPDLKKYYKAEFNDGKHMSEFTAGSGKRVNLCCDVCEHIKNVIPHQYIRGSSFVCDYCNSLANSFPHIAEEWHPTKNGEVTPLDVYKVSNKKFYWLGKCGHEWEAVISNRTNLNNGCPYCRGFYITEKNSLAHNYPHMVQEWNHAVNGKYIDVAVGTHQKFSWICSKGHEWIAQVHSRVSKNAGCPHCSISKGEKAIENFLKEIDMNYKLQYSANVEKSTRRFDIYIPSYNLYIEIMGNQHYKDNPFFTMSLEKQQKIDAQKKKYAEQNGYYMAVDYREHNPVLTLERFLDQLDEFHIKFINGVA